MTAAECIAAVRARDIRQVAKLITRIEDGDPAAAEIVAAFGLMQSRAHVVGVTGAPGSGKSTLVDQLLALYRRDGKQIAVLAIDPSSPFSGGAILGDRVRMQRHANDEQIFIRSMSARGALGGLAKPAADVISILKAMGNHFVIVETVGVGQNEVDIVRHADTVVLVDSPNSGDAVQSVKAGVMEIGHIFIVNKADQPGAERRMQYIGDMLRNSTLRNSWAPPVIATDALTGLGVAELRAAIDAHGGSLRPVKH